jgi:hypothetical protein
MSKDEQAIDFDNTVDRLIAERNNAEKREYAALGRANFLEAELKATRARLAVSDELLREEFAQKADALATLREIGDFAHARSTGPAVEDALWEVRNMAYAMLTPSAMVEASLTPNAKLTGVRREELK